MAACSREGSIDPIPGDETVSSVSRPCPLRAKPPLNFRDDESEQRLSRLVHRHRPKECQVVLHRLLIETKCLEPALSNKSKKRGTKSRTTTSTIATTSLKKRTQVHSQKLRVNIIPKQVKEDPNFLKPKDLIRWSKLTKKTGEEKKKTNYLREQYGKGRKHKPIVAQKVSASIPQVETMQRASSTAITPVKISSMPSLDPVAMPAEPAASPSSEPLLPKRDDEEREAILSGNCQRDPAGRMIAPASPQSISGGSSCCHLIPSPKHASTPLSNKVGLNKSAISEQDKDATTQQQQQQQHCEGGTEERQFLSIKPLSTTTSALQDHKHLNVCTAVKEFQFGNVGDDSECSFICNSECSEDSPAVDHVKTQTGSLEAEADLAKTHHLEKSANSSLVPKEKTLKRRKIADYIAENKAKRKKKLDTMEDGELEESDEDISIVNIVKNSRSPDCRPKQRNKRGQRKQHRRRHYYSNSDSSSTSNSLTSSSPSSFGDGQSESDDSLEIIEEGPLTSRHGHHSGVVAEKSTVVNAREENKSDINLPLQEALAHTSEQVLATVSDAALAQPPIALRPLAHLEQGGIRHDLHESLSGGEQLDYEPFSESYAEESDSVEGEPTLSDNVKKRLDLLLQRYSCAKVLEFGQCHQIARCKHNHDVTEEDYLNFFHLIAEAFPAELPKMLQAREDKRLHRLVGIFNSNKAKWSEELWLKVLMEVSEQIITAEKDAFFFGCLQTMKSDLIKLLELHPRPANLDMNSAREIFNNLIGAFQPSGLLDSVAFKADKQRSLTLLWEPFRLAAEKGFILSDSAYEIVLEILSKEPQFRDFLWWGNCSNNNQNNEPAQQQLQQAPCFQIAMNYLAHHPTFQVPSRFMEILIRQGLKHANSNLPSVISAALTGLTRLHFQEISKELIQKLASSLCQVKTPNSKTSELLRLCRDWDVEVSSSLLPAYIPSTMEVQVMEQLEENQFEEISKSFQEIPCKNLVEISAFCVSIVKGLLDLSFPDPMVPALSSFLAQSASWLTKKPVHSRMLFRAIISLLLSLENPLIPCNEDCDIVEMEDTSSSSSSSLYLCLVSSPFRWWSDFPRKFLPQFDCCSKEGPLGNVIKIFVELMIMNQNYAVAKDVLMKENCALQNSVKDDAAVTSSALAFLKSVSIEIWSPDLWRYFLEVFDLFVEKFSFASQEEIFNNILKTSILAWGKGTLFGKPEKDGLLKFLDEHNFRGLRYDPPSLRCLVHLLNQEITNFPESLVLKFYTIGVDLGLYPRQGVTEGGATITIMSNWTEEEMAVALKAAVWDQLGGQGNAASRWILNVSRCEESQMKTGFPPLDEMPSSPEAALARLDSLLHASNPLSFQGNIFEIKKSANQFWILRKPCAAAPP